MEWSSLRSADLYSSLKIGLGIKITAKLLLIHIYLPIGSKVMNNSSKIASHNQLICTVIWKWCCNHVSTNNNHLHEEKMCFSLGAAQFQIQGGRKHSDFLWDNDCGHISYTVWIMVKIGTETWNFTLPYKSLFSQPNYCTVSKTLWLFTSRHIL